MSGFAVLIAQVLPVLVLQSILFCPEFASSSCDLCLFPSGAVDRDDGNFKVRRFTPRRTGFNATLCYPSPPLLASVFLDRARCTLPSPRHIVRRKVPSSSTAISLPQPNRTDLGPSPRDEVKSNETPALCSTAFPPFLSGECAFLDCVRRPPPHCLTLQTPQYLFPLTSRVSRVFLERLASPSTA